MKKLKNAIWFIIIFIMIFIVYFYIYKNIDKFIPKHENEIYFFANNIKNEQSEFLYEMIEYIQSSSYKSKFNEADSNKIKENEILYNLIKKASDDFYEDEKYEAKIMSSYLMGELNNTIYGDLKFITSEYTVSKKERYSIFWIAYSEDMSKIYYYNPSPISNVSSIGNEVIFDEYTEKGVETDISDGNVYDSNNENIDDSKQYEQNKDEILQNGKKAFSNLIINKEFDPNTIIHKDNYYILKDTTRDITVYYDMDFDDIVGLYMGFGV